MNADTLQPRNESCWQLASADLVAALSERSAYFYETEHVELLETHISWLFLTDRYVYKVKKPVRFEYLDFSTLGKRRQACLDEVRLNRRLAPHVYLDIVPIRQTAHGLIRIGGAGAPVDWAVRMRRLDADKSVDQLILRRQLTPRHIQQLTNHLVSFYDRLPPESIRTDQYRAQIEQHVLSNWEDLDQESLDLPRTVVDSVHQAQLRLLRIEPTLFDNRVLDGRIVEGHGDLRPEHIYFTPSPVVIDCIEFSRELRTLDVFDELNFLAMECERLNAEDVANQIVNAYLRNSGDQPDKRLGSFYRAYRACVRAKVAAQRSAQLQGEEARQSLLVASEYLELAASESRQLGPPLLLFVSGISGSGKSTLATEISESLQVEHFHTDEIRHQLFGKTSASEYDRGDYQPARRDAVYDEMVRRAESRLRQGLSVVLDGTFLKNKWRDEAIQAAQRAGARALMVLCDCPPDIARQRIAQRLRAASNDSDASPDFPKFQAVTLEPPREGMAVCRVDTTTSRQPMLDTVFASLRKS